MLRNHDVAPTLGRLPPRRSPVRRQPHAGVRDRLVEPHLLLAELTDDEVSAQRQQYAGRAVIAPDAPMSPFCT